MESDSIVTAIAAFGRESGVYDFMNTAWGWPCMESLHFMGLAVLLGTVGLFDLRMLGMAKGVPFSALHKLVPFGVFAYLANIVTGTMFFVSAPDQYLYNPAFQLKTLCMLIAGLNVVVFYSTLSKSVKSLAPEATASLPVKVIASVSLFSWLGVIVFGRVITYFRPPYYWCFWC
jgi:hypothetical protein